MPGSRFSSTISALVAALILGYTSAAGAQSSETTARAPSPAPAVPCNAALAALNPAVPLALRLSPHGIVPSQPQQFGVSWLDRCGGGQTTAPATQPFTAEYPYPGSWWDFGVHGPTLYHGT